ncbi:pseudouridine synthase [Variovorax sp. ZT4R33]|uniref:pseudouridine synthase n=1 Tax=Variovorax sp. ZT4R33 TaxID=3443743 RepID=UPI003F48CC65
MSRPAPSSSPPPPPSDAPLPTRDGVGPSTVGLPAGAWPTMLDFLLERFPGVTPATWRGRMQAGDVVDEGGRPVRADDRYRGHQRLYYYREIPDEPRVPFEERVLFQDAHLLVADKPHFLPVTPGGRYLQESLLVRLKRKLGIETLAPIHRIDRGTAGLVLFCVDPAGRAAYQKLFAERRVVKTYEAVVHWPAGMVLPAVRHSRLAPDASFMRTAEIAGEPNSTTHFELLERIGDDRARLRLSPVTGRKHQLRVHCAALGMPIVNDPIYPVLRPEGEEDHAQPLQLLAKTLAFIDPCSGEARRFASTLKLAG